MKEIAFLVLGALLEVGGDAAVRFGLKSGRAAGFLLGAAVLFSYGLVVNVPKWDFGKLMGAYIAVFFVVSQAVAFVFWREKPAIPTLLGGALIVAGGMVLSFWKV